MTFHPALKVLLRLWQDVSTAFFASTIYYEHKIERGMHLFCFFRHYLSVSHFSV